MVEAFDGRDLMPDLKAAVRLGGSVGGLAGAAAGLGASGWPWEWCVPASLVAMAIGRTAGGAAATWLFGPPGKMAAWGADRVPVVVAARGAIFGAVLPAVAC